MNIGIVAKQSGVAAKTIRYYESVGLLPKPNRSASGYRQYGSNDIQVLRFIQRARSLGFAVRDVEDLLELWRNQERASADVKALANRHIKEIDFRMHQLQEMRDSLSGLIEQCHGDEHPDCPILESFAGE